MALGKWHVNSKGPAKCHARVGNCPYGSDENDHFDKFEDAVVRYEEESEPKDLYLLTYPPEVDDYAELEEEYGDDAYNVAQDIIDVESEYLREEIDRQIQDSNVLYDEHGEPYNAVRIEGKNMGWRHRSGHRIMRVEDFTADPINSVAVNSDYTQQWNVTEDGITVTQYHHDAPMGETYEFEFYHADEDELIEWAD